MTTERKSHHPLEGGHRITAYTFDTNELVLITDPTDALYDKRIERPLKREFLLNIAARGVETAISIRRRGNDNIVARGKQRTKTVTVINALACGVAYTGDVKAIHAAIREFGADQDLVKKLTLWVKKPMKIRALPANSGDDRHARMGMRSENAQRAGDILADRIEAAREEHEKYGTEPEEIALNEGVSVATVKRWLNPTKRKKASGPPRPTAKQIESVLGPLRAQMTPREVALVDWMCKGGTNKSMAELFVRAAS